MLSSYQVYLFISICVCTYVEFYNPTHAFLQHFFCREAVPETLRPVTLFLDVSGSVCLFEDLVTFSAESILL